MRLDFSPFDLSSQREEVLQVFHPVGETVQSDLSGRTFIGINSEEVTT